MADSKIVGYTVTDDGEMKPITADAAAAVDSSTEGDAKPARTRKATTDK